MKKSTVLFTVFCLLICCLVGCTAKPAETNGSTTSPSTVATTTSTTTPPPDDDSPGIGGMNGNWYFNTDFCDHYSLDGCVSDLVDQEIFSAWANEFKAMNPAGTRDNSELNAYVFIREMKIPREKIEAVCEWYENRDIVDGVLYTDAQIEAIYNGTEEDCKLAFASPYAIVVGSNIYSPKWLYEHTVEDYVAAGITGEIFQAKLPHVIFACDREEHWTTILAKYDALRRLEEPTYTGKSIDKPAEVTAGGKAYSAQWLLEHTAEEYRAAGITYDLLSESIVNVFIKDPKNRFDVYKQYVALQKLEAAENATVW